MPQNLNSVIFIVLAFLLGLLVKSFLPNYVKKKAENLATKEDIEKITEQVEAVKAKIDINTDAHKSYINDRKKALLDFFDYASTFHYELISVNFGDFPMDEGKSLFEYQSKFYKTVSELVKHYQRLVIFFPPESVLLKTANRLTSNATQSRKILKENFGQIKKTSVEEHLAYAAIPKVGQDPYHKAVESANIANKNYWDLMRPLVGVCRAEYQNYLNGLNKYMQDFEIEA